MVLPVSTQSSLRANSARRIVLDSLLLATIGVWGFYVAAFLRLVTAENWLALYWWPPYAFHLTLLALYAIVCLVVGRGTNRLLSNLACSSALFLLFSFMTVRPLGDRVCWLLYARTGVVALSEALSCVAYHWALVRGIDLRLIAPFVGWVACFLFLTLADDVLPADAPASARTWFRLYLPSLGFPLVFFHNYIENTLFAVPFAILYLLFAIRYVGSPTTRSLLAASAFLALACLFHGQNTFLLPSLALLILYQAARRGDYRRVARDMLMSGGVLLGIAAIVLLAVWVSGHKIETGNISGGGDYARFVPLSSAGDTKYTRFHMLSVAHFVEVANIVVHASPAILVLVPVWAFRRVKRHAGFLDSCRDDPALVASGALTICYVVFILLWNFDVGFPSDLDLMIAMSSSLSVLVFSLLYRLSRSTRRILPASVLLALYITTLFSGFFLAPRLP